jgi:hypothetical protein
LSVTQRALRVTHLPGKRRRGCRVRWRSGHLLLLHCARRLFGERQHRLHHRRQRACRRRHWDACMSGGGGVGPGRLGGRLRTLGGTRIRMRVGCHHTAMGKLRIVTLARFGAGRQKMVLEGRTTPTLPRRACFPRHGLQSWRGKSAGVAKQPRELISPTKSLSVRFATFESLCSSCREEAPSHLPACWGRRAIFFGWGCWTGAWWWTVQTPPPRLVM